MKIAIIGAGPAGSYTGYLLAKIGHKVHIYEKNQKIGSPVRCTGILSDYFVSIMSPKEEFVVNTVNNTRIYAPNGKFVGAKIKKNYIICRKKFDNYLAGLAKKEGAKYYLNHSFISYVRGEKIEIILNNNGKKVKQKVDILIGADGPNSTVAREVGLFENRNFLIGTQIEVKKKNDNVVEFYPYLGSYGWIVPVDKKTVRIGLASYGSGVKIFKKFAKEKIGKNYDKKTIENQSGVIPIFNPRVKAQKEKIYLIGDAATFVKATSGGGINQSLKAAEILAECVDKGKNYDREWRKTLYRNLHTHLIIHKMLEKFSDNDWNDLIRIFSQRKMKKILYSKSRENIVKMLLSVARNNPVLFRYVKYFPFEELKNLF